MKLQNKYKIALVGFRLGTGGTERVMAHLSVFFDSVGIEVHLITVMDAYGYAYKGTVLSSTSLNKGYGGLRGRVHRFIGLYRYFQKEQFDFIIDFRFRLKRWEELLIAKCLYRAPTILTIHSSKLEVYLPSSRTLARFMYGTAHAVLSISEAGKKKVEALYGFENSVQIVNPIRFDLIDAEMFEQNPFDFEFILGVGQFEDHTKQFDHLIEAFAKSRLRERKIHLVLLGMGKLEGFLKEQCVLFGVSDWVHFLGFQENPYRFMRAARFLVLSSKFEGFSMVLVETLATGTPVVSYDCEYGPSEIIREGKNGFLVENQNKEKLSEAMNRMVSDEVLYEKLKSNARDSVLSYSLEEVGQAWLKLMKMS